MTEVEQVQSGATPTGDLGALPHRRFVTFLVATTAVLALSLTAVVWAWNYQPMEPGTIGGVQAPGINVRSLSNAYGTEYRVVAPEPGAEITMVVSTQVPRGAWFPVTIESIDSPFALRGDGADVAHVETVDVTYTRLGESRAVPLDADGLTLEPGDLVTFDVTVTIPDCPRMEYGSSASSDTVPVTYSALGRSHDLALPMGYMVVLQQAPECR